MRLSIIVWGKSRKVKAAVQPEISIKDMYREFPNAFKEFYFKVLKIHKLL